MPHVIIDGQRIETSPGKTIIQAIYDNGMQVPHFCWHPELSVAGNCRMCLVEVGSPKRNSTGDIELDEAGNPVVNFIPKLQIACATPVSDGMVVHTKNHKANEAQEAVMEFLLINHPLDCPICDEAGECKLQEYAFRHSKGESRFTEAKNHKPKRQVWGPNVLFDAERCISCSRCIRFSQEVAKQDVLTFVQRGDKVTIELFENTVFDSPYSMNVIELCPVGALTSSDFRFKARVWDMTSNPSISFADGSGANTNLGVRNNELLRVQPRVNMYVNKYWLSDHARLSQIDFVNQDRVTEPMIKTNGTQQISSWDAAIEATTQKLKSFKADEIMFLASGKATNESNFLFSKFVKSVVKSNNLDFLPHLNKNTNEGPFEANPHTVPNMTGAKEVGANGTGLKYTDLAEKINNGTIKALYIMEDDFSEFAEINEVVDKLDLLIVHTYNTNDLVNKADVVLPASTYAEIEGTYTNTNGRVQHFKPALVTKENLRYMGLSMSRLDKFGAFNDRWTQHELRNCRQSWRIIRDLALSFGAEWRYKDSEAVFNDIAKSIPAFAGMSYELLEEYQGLVLNKANAPEPKINNYVSHVMKLH